VSAFEDAVIQRIKQLEREVERLKRWERPIGGGGVTDHGSLSGLTDDDHTQYLNNTRHDTTARHTLGTVVPHDDHGQLTGLADDDHTQYTKHPASSTDNAIVRWDGTGGRTLQNSSVAIDDNGKLSGNGLDGWIYDTDTWTYVSATSFKITGKDVRYRFPKGTKIKLVQSGATKYFYVIATAYTSGNTIITITGGSDYALANENISGQAYSYADAPQLYPNDERHIRIITTSSKSIPNNTWTAITFDSIALEVNSGLTSQWSSGSNTKLICRLPGRYLIIGSVRFSGNTTGQRGLNIKKNGNWSAALLVPPPGSFETIYSLSEILNLDLGDYVELFAFQNSGAELSIPSNNQNTNLHWERVGS